uniref:Uncharacterized protein n=1 Tax=Heterorhabditis bacteriophora TaxID=37862 RepID=A0A1I7WLM6_HETBA
MCCRCPRSFVIVKLVSVVLKGPAEFPAYWKLVELESFPFHCISIKGRESNLR